MSSNTRNFKPQHAILLFAAFGVTTFLIRTIKPQDYFLHYLAGEMILNGKYLIHPITQQHWLYLDELGKIVLYLYGKLLPHTIPWLWMPITYYALIVLPALLIVLPHHSVSHDHAILYPLLFLPLVHSDLRTFHLTFPLLAVAIRTTNPIALTTTGFLWNGFHGSWAVGLYYTVLSGLSYSPTLKDSGIRKGIWFTSGALLYSVALGLITGNWLVALYKATSGLPLAIRWTGIGGEWGTVDQSIYMATALGVIVTVAALKKDWRMSLAAVPGLFLIRIVPYASIYILSRDLSLTKRTVKKPMLLTLITLTFIMFLMMQELPSKPNEIAKIAREIPEGSKVACYHINLAYELKYYNPNIEILPKEIYELIQNPQNSTTLWKYISTDYFDGISHSDIIIVQKWGQPIIAEAMESGFSICGKYGDLTVLVKK